MSKRITRISLGAAVAVAATAVAGGAFASAASLPDSPTADNAISGTVIQINEDGTGIECTLTGSAAEQLVGPPIEVPIDATDVVASGYAVAVGDESAPGIEIPEGAELPDGVAVGELVVGSTGVTEGAPDLGTAAEVAPIVDFDAAEVRPGTDEECAAITGNTSISAVPSDAAAKD